MRKTDRDVSRIFRERPDVFANHTNPSGNEDTRLSNWEIMDRDSYGTMIYADGVSSQPELQFIYESSKYGIKASLLTWYGYELDPKYKYDVYQDKNARTASVIKSHVELDKPSRGGYVYEDTINERISRNPNRTFRALARLTQIIEIQNSGLSREA